MSCKLIKNIRSTCLYNPGGIAEIKLLDISDFFTYRFAQDSLYTHPFVDNIFRLPASQYINLETVSESNFTETQSNGLYKQSLSTFVHTLSADTLHSLLIAKDKRYLIVFRTLQNTYFTFGSDTGASLEFTQLSGQTGETNGYTISITATSAYPLFETHADALLLKYDSLYQPLFDTCEQAVFVPNFDHYKCETK
ncbi:MAG: hypothetical protein RL662_442 [Bacteroidota bacterium]|jgi:hypothetical protein